MKTRIDLPHHTLHGTQDDVTNNQVLIFWHPNGLDCHVFVMDGTGCGGGISFHKEGRFAKDLDVIIGESNSDYELKNKIIEYLVGEY